jgi:phosphoribosylamine-glycine ligase
MGSNYKKTYTKKLAAKVVSELRCDTFVIKPRGQFMGRGVIIVQEQDLDEVLHYIITKSANWQTAKTSPMRPGNVIASIVLS